VLTEVAPPFGTVPTTVTVFVTVLVPPHPAAAAANKAAASKSDADRRIMGTTLRRTQGPRIGTSPRAICVLPRMAEALSGASIEHPNLG
jgi:hypothetical protein